MTALPVASKPLVFRGHEPELQGAQQSSRRGAHLLPAHAPALAILPQPIHELMHRHQLLHLAIA